jgi:hypothetical protein
MGGCVLHHKRRALECSPPAHNEAPEDGLGNAGDLVGMLGGLQQR